MKAYFTFLLLIVSVYLYAQDSLTMLFTGDVMQHQSQINYAYDPIAHTYRYDTSFAHVKPLFTKHDIVVANLEVTLGGAPYSGYPAFSSPDQLAFALKDAGVDIVACANNHVCDRGKNGILRTINVLDSLHLPHMGSYSDSENRAKTYPIFFTQNNISIALLNYTYGTNGITVAAPIVVNYIDQEQIKKDIATAKAAHPDFIIVFIHWGNEYERLPNKTQKDLAAIMFTEGVDIIVGSHPHVIQPMEFKSGKLIYYSLGNFLSNQRKQYTDGGALASFTLVKQYNMKEIRSAGYYLTWVYTPLNNEKKYFMPLPVRSTVDSIIQGKEARDSFNIFINDSKTLLDTYNINVPEKSY